MGVWREYTVDDFADVIGGGTPKTSIEAFWSGEIPWISPKDLSDYNDRRIQRGERNISLEGLKSSSAKILPKNAVLLTSRAPVGYLAIADNEVTTNQGFRSLVVKGNFDFLFVYYLLKNNVEYLKQHATGSTFQELSGSTLKALKFRLPEDKKEQQKISSILSSLDDKIELNRKMNETLEEMARAIFKSWFVDFDPVHAKARGEKPAGMPDEIADLFPSEFVHSDQLNKPIPKGWEITTLECVCTELCRGITPKYSENEGIKVINQKCIRNNEIDMSLCRLNDTAKKKINGRYVEYGDVLVNSTGVGTLGRLAQYTNEAEEQVTYDTHVTLVRPEKTKCLEHLFGYFMSLNQPVIEEMGEGSTGQTELKRDVLGKLKIILPSREIMVFADNFFKETIKSKNRNNNESIILKGLRDSLLPKLISGEIEV